MHLQITFTQKPQRLLAILFLLVAVTQFACDKTLPSDEELERNFTLHRSVFEKLVQMAQIDAQMRRITPSFSTTQTGEEGGLAPVRWDEYRQLFKTAQLDGGLLNSENGSNISFYAVGRGMITGGEIKGYVYSTHEPSPLLDSLNDIPSKVAATGPTTTFYKKLQDNWYLTIEID